MSTKAWSNLAKIVYRRTYARKDTGVIEDWPKTVERVLAGNFKKVFLLAMANPKTFGATL